MRFQRAVLVIACLVPAVTEAAAPGTLINADPVVETPAGTQAWRIRYWTTSDRGAEIEVTGMVIAPREAMPARPRAVLAYAHGTSGVVEKCAPSIAPNFFTATPGITEAVRRGYVFVAPDYPGLGTSMPHPYLVGTSTAYSMLDGVRAARSIPGAASGSRFAVWGESQGGHAALWTGQLARSYAPDLQLMGVAAAAPPTDLVENLRAGSDPSIRAFLTAFTAYSWSQHFNAPLSTLGNRATAGVITRLAQNNCIVLGKKPKLGTMLGVLVLRRDLKNVDLGTIQPWARIARQNSPAARDYGVPFLIAQNPKDVIVGPAVTLAYTRKLCRSGARVRYIAISGQGHETSARDTVVPTLDWVDARFAGKPARSDCGKI
jgi:acetyl esterase/lipase